MKIVFFRQLLEDCEAKEWTPAQQMVYSHILSKSIVHSGIFRGRGKKLDYVEIANDYCDEYGRIEIKQLNVQHISDELKLSRQNVYDCIRFLKSIRYIEGDSIYCPKDIIYHGYFELKVETGLTKQLLIFYSWMVDRNMFVGDVAFACCAKIEKLFGTTESHIRNMIARLKKKGLVERVMEEDSRYGKIIIK